MGHYVRLLRYIYLADLFVNEDMVLKGYAHEYTYDRPYAFRNDFLAKHKEARDAGLGLWSACLQS
jgi:micrococcal nuclease